MTTQSFAQETLRQGLLSETLVSSIDPNFCDGGSTGRVRRERALEPEIVAAVQARCNKQAVPLSVAFPMLVGCFFGQATRQQQVLLAGWWGTQGKPQRIPIRVSIEEGITIGELIHRVHEETAASRFEPSFAVELAESLELGAGVHEASSFAIEASERALEFCWSVAHDKPALIVDADARYFDEASLDLCLQRLERGVRVLGQEGELLVSDIDWSVPLDRELLSSWGEASDPPGLHRTVSEQFDAVVSRFGSRTAIVSEQGSLSYAELSRRANALAAHLRESGVRAGDRVVVCGSRTPALMIALLGILKAGAAYVPIEPTYPPGRILFMIEDAGPRLALVSDEFREDWPHTVPIVPLESAASTELAESPSVELSSESCAYLLYTSGSTGKPKGVAVPHRAILRLVTNANFAVLDNELTMLQAAPVAFDASTLEIWGPLLNGGRLALYPDAVPTARGLGEAIRKFEVTALWLTASLFNTVIDEDPEQLRGVRQLLTGGEALSVPHVVRALETLPNTELINGYGPTETTTFATCYSIPRSLSRESSAVPIGSPIQGTALYVLDEKLCRVPVGFVGELYIGGAGVALGYHRREDLTAERFVPDPFRPGQAMYRTGDLVRFRRGALDFIGRVDHQVKIHGFRIELGEIEAALGKLEGVKACAVLARERANGERRLVAYVVLEPTGERNETRLKAALSETLPHYMVPSAVAFLEALPITQNGKLNRALLPDIEVARPELTVPFVAPRSDLEQIIQGVWQRLVGLDRLGVEDNLFELGATSLLAVRAVAQLDREHQLTIPIVEVFQRPTVAAQARYLRETSFSRTEPTSGLRPARRPRGRLERIAVVGMAGRFPGARNVAELWQRILKGEELISFFGPDQLDPGISPALRQDPDYVAARGIIEGPEDFDAPFFAVNPKEATVTDPQQRVLMEVCWEALEHAGYFPEAVNGQVGIFVGKYNNSYFTEYVQKRPDLTEEFGAFATMLANEKDYIATRIADRLHLTGPAVSIHTACSTSLVATVQAMHSLQLGQCDMALAGGVSITFPVRSGHLYQEGSMLSKDGHTRSFDARATGTVFSDGAAVVVLKRLSAALEDGDTIYGVLRAGAVNNDGGGKASFTAPSVAGQAQVIARAQDLAGITPDQVSYVEAHGTATPLGDPIEVAALTQAFRRGTEQSQFCALGSLKSNVGHLVIAAGAAGLIKTLLALKHEVIPPSLFCEEENPNIGFETTPFFVASTQRPWPRGDSPRYAGVSSFGVGGTNAHVVVQEPPPSHRAAESERSQLLLLSARSEAALSSARERLARYFEEPNATSLADAAFTLHAGRKAFSCRAAIVARTATEAVTALRSSQTPRAVSGGAPAMLPSLTASGDAADLAFLFPGQGAQHQGMAREVYREHAGFRGWIDRAASLLRPLLPFDLLGVMFAEADREGAPSDQVRSTLFAQPALFAVEYALARLWLEWGVRPRAMIGHSVGEFVAAALAGVMDFEDALRLVVQRAKLMQALPGGSMLSVRTAAKEIEPCLTGNLAIAADNAPKLCVVSGPDDEVAGLCELLGSLEIPCKRLATSHAFHSSAMDAVVEPFRKHVAEIPLSAPRLPIVSTATGTWLSQAQATDPGYWAQHLRGTVRFRQALETWLRDSKGPLLEVGPRATLTTLARQLTDAGRVTIASQPNGDTDQWAALLKAAGTLWVSGFTLSSAALHGPERRRVPLPTYPFEHRRYSAAPAMSFEGARSSSTDANEPVHLPNSPQEVRLPEGGGTTNSPAPSDELEAVIAEQLSVMEQQLSLLQGQPALAESGDGEEAAGSAFEPPVFH